MYLKGIKIQFLPIKIFCIRAIFNCKLRINAKCWFYTLQVALVSVCLLSGAVHGQEDKNFDIKKLLELYKTAKKGGFNFEKVNFDAVCSLSQSIKWQKYSN